MARSRFGEVAVEAIGDAAGTAVEPRRGLARLRAVATAPAVLAVGTALLAGYLLGRRRTG